MLRIGALLVLLVFVSCQQTGVNGSGAEDKEYLLESLDASQSGIEFINQLSEDEDHNIIKYIYYYNGAGLAIGDVNNDELPDIYFVANQGENKLYLNQGGLNFKDVTSTAGVQGSASWNTGATMVDVNQDGLLDIYVCAVSGLLDFTGHNELFLNNGDGTFTESSKKFGLDFQGYSTQSYFFDYDKDDDLDVYIVNHAIHTTLSHGSADSRNKRMPKVGDVLFRNEQGSFVDVSEEAQIFGGVNGYGLSAAISDFNNDGWEDIYVCNDFHEDDYYYLNNGDGTFREALGETFSTISRFSMGSDAADINQDGYTDLVTLDMLPNNEAVVKETEGDDAMLNMQNRLRGLGYKDQYSRNMLQLNRNGKFFQESAILGGIAATDWSWAPLLADFNNDSKLDLFVSNGIRKRPNGLDFVRYVSSAMKKGGSEAEVQEWLYRATDKMLNGDVSNEIFMGNANVFVSKTGDWIEDRPQISNGAVYSDLDGDGDLDLVLNNFNGRGLVYRNNSDSTNNHLTIHLNYKVGNREGIGAKVTLHAQEMVQTKEIHKSRGFQSAIDGSLHFGLGPSVKIDSVIVLWPDFKKSVLLEPEINSRLNIDYGKVLKSPLPKAVGSSSPKEDLFKRTLTIPFVHQEDIYDDFFDHKLMPYRISNLGPIMALGDVDKNGYQDVFIGNASGQNAKLYLNNGVGFMDHKVKSIAQDAHYEDNDAIFVDVDNDADLDLIVASGITSKRVSEKWEGIRVYVNQNGTFHKVPGVVQLPKDNLLTSTIIANDYDADGDQDLFIGNLGRYHDFGGCVDSYLLKNDGMGRFSMDTAFKLVSRVNSAVWKDIDGDGLEDLLVATDWDSPKVYSNEGGILELVEVSDGTQGLWRSINSFDVDKDGDQDIVLGNWGLNTKYSLNFDGPLRMYYSDFDSNGSTETILAYNKGGVYYPLNSKMEMGSQINAINKLHVYHSDYAGKSIRQILGSESLQAAELYEVQLLASGYLENKKGAFKEFKAFPDELQYAPINALKEIELNKEKYLLIGGNLKGVNAYHGGYTSLKGTMMGSLEEIIQTSQIGLPPIDGQLQDFETVKMKHGNLLFTIINKDTLRSYSYE